MSGDQENYDRMPRKHLEALAAKNDIGGVWKMAQRALNKMDRAEDGKIADDRHGEQMLAASVANRRSKQALAVGFGALVLALVSIIQQCQG